MKEIKFRHRFLVDDPVHRELEAFWKRSEGKPLHEEVRAAAIKGLVLNQDWNHKIEVDGKEFAPFVEYIREGAAASDRGFFISLARALKEERQYKNAEVEHFLFKNWDSWDGTALGLKHFTDEAVTELLNIRFGNRQVLSLGAYRAIRKNAALQPEREKKIRQVTLGADRNVYARAQRTRPVLPKR
jgi:hypothetical protein